MTFSAGIGLIPKVRHVLSGLVFALGSTTAVGQTPSIDRNSRLQSKRADNSGPNYFSVQTNY